MEIVYSSHAIERMRERNISPDEVLRVCSEPDGLLLQSMDKRIIYKKLSHRHDNLITVVAVEHIGLFLEVITAMSHFELR